MEQTQIKTGLEQYPEFKPLVDRLIELSVNRINNEAVKIESEMRYKRQFVLEMFINRLQELV